MIYSIKIGLQNFFRNFWLAGAMIIILILMFLSFSFLISLNILVQQTINSVREKVDLSIYLKPDITQSSLNNLRTDIENLSQVEEVKVVSPQQAFENFKEKHKDDQDIIKSLAEINHNPFGATLLIRTKPNADINPLLEIATSARYEDIIQDRDFTNYQELVNKIDFMGRRIKFLGFIISGIFILLVVLIIFNAVRLSIYARLEEIKMMRLVGATASLIRAPFLVEIFISAVIAFIIGIALFLGLVYKFQSQVMMFLGLKINLIDYLFNHGLVFFGGQIIFIILLCWSAASAAMAKYLKA